MDWSLSLTSVTDGIVVPSALLTLENHVKLDISRIDAFFRAVGDEKLMGPPEATLVNG